MISILQYFLKFWKRLLCTIHNSGLLKDFFQLHLSFLLSQCHHSALSLPNLKDTCATELNWLEEWVSAWSVCVLAWEQIYVKKWKSYSVMSNSFDPMNCKLPRLLYPCNTGVDSHSLFKGIFFTQGSNRCLLQWRKILYCLSYQYLYLRVSWQERKYIWSYNFHHFLLYIQIKNALISSYYSVTLGGLYIFKNLGELNLVEWTTELPLKLQPESLWISLHNILWKAQGNSLQKQQ